jgi:hypothetical protein
VAREDPVRASRLNFTAFAAILIGAALIYFVLPLHIAVLFAPLALIGAIGTLASGAIRAEQARKRSKMERGEGVVAQWNLNASDWRELVRLNAGPLTFPPLSGEASASFQGVEVVFAEDAIYIDGDYHTMDRDWNTIATFESPYTFVELSQGGLETITPIRIPVPPKHIPDAERVVRHFNSRP